MSHHDTATTDVNPEGWRKPAVLTYVNTDTLSVKEAALVLRYGPEVTPQYGRYIIEVTAPSGARCRDTVNITLTPDVSVNSLQETRIPYRMNVTLGESGDYVFTITPPTGTYDIWNAAIDFRKIL